MKELLIIISLCLEWLLISIIVISYNKDIKPLYGIIPALILAIILTIPQDILIKLNSIFIISLILITMLKSNINIRRVYLFFLIFFFFVLEFSKISFSIRNFSIILILFIVLLFISKNINIERFLSSKGIILSIVAIKIFFNRDIFIPFIENRIIKFLHDIVHIAIVLFLIPDHPFIRINLWNLIGIIFGKRTDLIISMIIILLPSIIYIINLTKAKPPDFPQFKIPAERRKAIASFKRDKRLKAIPVIISTLIIIVSGYSGYSSYINIYDPEPIPVVDNRIGFINVPLSTPAYSISDKTMHKYTYNFQGKNIIFFVIMRADNKIVSALDMCEVCEPEGYGQLDENLFCKYCKTPIPINTIGEPGGCNPIPLNSNITSSNIIIKLDELIFKYGSKMK